jgi:hypothetical protein
VCAFFFYRAALLAGDLERLAPDGFRLMGDVLPLGLFLRPCLPLEGPADDSPLLLGPSLRGAFLAAGLASAKTLVSTDAISTSFLASSCNKIVRRGVVVVISLNGFGCRFAWKKYMFI